MDRKTIVDLQTKYNQYIALSEAANKIKLAVGIVLVFLAGFICRAVNFQSPYVGIIILLDLAGIIATRILIGRAYAQKQRELMTAEEVKLVKAITHQELFHALNGSAPKNDE